MDSKYLPIKISYTLFLYTILSLQLATAQQTLNKTMIYNNLTREYIVYIPILYDGSNSMPLLFNFHGYGGQANSYMNFADMRTTSDTAGFILVYPQGYSNGNGDTHWEVGDLSAVGSADDLGFVEAMIDTLNSEYNINLERVYSCGMSNGGYFSFEIACHLSDRIAAVFSVAGSMADQTYNHCNPTHPTPVATIHGTADSTVHYFGGGPWNPVSLPLVNLYWANYNNTNDMPVITNLPDIEPLDGTTIEHSIFSNGDSCTSVEHYKVVGGGHWYWPGVNGNMDINASSVIWDFVSKYDIHGLIDCGGISINDISADRNKIQIFPNPFESLFTVKMEIVGNKDYQIYSTIGELLQSGSINSNNMTIDLSRMPNSMYFLKIDDRVTKLIKTK